MLGSKAVGSDAVGSDAAYVLGACERSHRELAGRLGRLEQAMRRAHPETMTVREWVPLRSALLDMIVAGRDQSVATANFLDALRRVMADASS